MKYIPHVIVTSVLIILFLGVFVFRLDQVNKTSQGFQESPQASTTHTLLSVPSFPMANSDSVALILGDRECGNTYLIERSHNGEVWVPIGTITFRSFAQPRDPALKDCENSYVDDDIPQNVPTLYYRYHLLNDNGQHVQTSEVASITIGS